MSEGIISDDLRAEDIDKDGMWHLPSGHVVDLRHVHLQLPDGLGTDRVLMVRLSVEGMHDECPLCKADMTQTDSLILCMENYDYVVGKCCNAMMLYNKKTTDVTQWT